MLGVLRRHWKPKRDNSGRKKKEKGGTDGGHELSLSPKETSRTCRTVRDTHQVHPEKEPDRVGVLGKDCSIVVTGQKEISLLSHPHILKDYHKDSSLSPVLSLKDEDFKDQISATEVEDSQSWEDNLKGESIDDKNSGEKQWRDFHGYVDSNIDNGSSRVIPKDNNAHVFKDKSPVRINDRNCSAKESVTTEDDDEKSESEGEKEKTDPAKESLERQVKELKSLRQQDHEVQLPREWVPREGLKQELEREKMLRTEAERRLNEMKLESERCKSKLASLHDDCRKMEEVVQSMLHFRSRIEQLKHEKSSITLNYESKIRKYQLCIASLEKENFMLQNELKSLEASNKDRQKERERSLSRILLERLQLLEQENSSLILENEQQRLQYERCLDDVANQVVHALLAQKCLREDCSKLQRRVQDLEYQNCTLTFMFKHRFLKPSEPSIQRFPTGQASDDCSRHSFQDSPSHTSHSEDSTESLASLCSDYSIHSGSSSSSQLVSSHPGLPKMSSPPQWMRERAVSLQTKSRSRLPASVVGSTTYVHQQPVLKRPGVEFMARHVSQEHKKEENIAGSDQVHLRRRKTIQRNSRKPYSTLLEGRVWQRLHEGILSPGRRDGAWHHKDHSQKKPAKFKSSKDSASEIGGLDAVETPSDECFNVEGLPLLTSTHRLLVSTQYRPVSEVWGPQPWNARNSAFLGRKETPSYVSCATQTYDVPEEIYFQRESQENRSNVPVTLTNRPAPGIPRPTTLNVVPHVMSDPAHNFNFPALEQKSHVVNKCGNVYEEIDLPVFPAERDKSGDCAFLTEKCILRHDSRMSGFTCQQQQEPLYSDTVEEQISSCEDSETAMNTVIRKTHHSETAIHSELHNELSSATVGHQELGHPHHALDNIPNSDDTNQPHLTENVFSVQRIESSLLVHENESPLSVGENREHGGKDEGYSTMSSDVLEVGGVVGFLDPVRKSRAGMAFNHSPSYLTFESSIPEPVAEGDEIGMLSSSDSGLGFQRSLQEMRQSSEELEEEEELCCGFERDLDSSLIRCEKNRNIEKLSVVNTSECTEVNKKKDDTRQDEVVCSVISSDDNISPSSSVISKDQNLDMNSTNLSSDHSKNIGHPVFDKIYTLLTPRGFRAHRSNPRRVTLPFIQQPESLCSTTYPFKQRIQTAEKATSTDPEQGYLNEEAFRDLSDSSISVSSTGSVGCVKVPSEHFKGSDNYIFENHSAEESGLKLHFKKTRDTVNIAVEVSHYGSVNSGTQKDNHNVSYCHPVQENYSIELHPENRSKSVPVKSVQENYNVQRAYSDSQLFVKSPEESGRDLMKSSSLSTKQPISRLNFPPLEHHMSACNLNSPPVTPSSLTPPLRRSQRQMLINHCQQLSQKQKLLNNSEISRWQTKRQHTPSTSLSSVHSTSSEEVVGEEEEEEFGATSLKCSKVPELSSASEDEYDLIEHHSFVEQWLQREGSNVSAVLQNGYTYDDEEVGNWSFHASTEDGVPPSSNNLNNSENLLNKTGEKSYTCHLEKIQEHSLEDEFQDDFWSNSLWNSVVTQNAQAENQSNSNWQEKQDDKDKNESNCTVPQTSSELDLHSVPVSADEEAAAKCAAFESVAVDSSETYVSTATWTASLSDSTIPPAAERMSPVGEEVEALLQDWSDLSSRQDSCCDVSVIVSEPLTCTEDSICSIPPSTESDKSGTSILQTEATEFNRDFYVLCAVGSTRSLTASECGSHVEPEHLYPVTCAISSVEGTHLERLVKEELKVNAVINPEQIISLEPNHNSAKLDTDIVNSKSWNPSEVGHRQEEEISNRVEVVKTKKVPPKLPSKKNKAKDSGVGSATFSPGKTPKSSNNYGLPEGKKSPNEKAKIPVRNASPEKKKNSGKNYVKSRTHMDHESRRSRDDRKRSPGKKHSGGKRTSSSRKASKLEEHKSLENKNLNQKANNDNEERKNKKMEKNSKSNFEEEKSKKDMGKLYVEKKISPEKTKLPKLNDLAGKSEKEELVTELELRLAGHSGTVADKIQELNALLADTELEKISTATPEKQNKVVNPENKESHDSSLERKNHIQKREKALSKESGIKEGCGTSWVHVEADIDLSDPKARANLLDSMMASSSSSSCGSSEEEEEEEEEGDGEDEVLEHKYHQRLHALHRFRRHRKRASDRDAVISFIPRIRASIIDRHDFYYRYGEKEKEAVACFDFLDELSTSPSDTGSCEVLSRDSAIAFAVLENNNIISNNIDPGRRMHNLNTHSSDTRTEPSKINRFSLDESRLSGSRRLPEEHLSSTTLNSQDGEPIDHISLSDSCAESYSSSTHSLNHIS